MKIISVINQKGGSGKTTLALHLAVAFSQAQQNTALIDLDPQASAANWGDRRAGRVPVVGLPMPAAYPMNCSKSRTPAGIL